MNSTIYKETLINCKNNPTDKVGLVNVPGFPQLGVLRGGICAKCSVRPNLRQSSRVVSYVDGEMIECVPAMTVDGLEVQLAVLRIIGASAKEIEDIERKNQVGEQ